jgi:hypothetical protein
MHLLEVYVDSVGPIVWLVECSNLLVLNIASRSLLLVGFVLVVFLKLVVDRQRVPMEVIGIDFVVVSLVIV